MTALQYAIARKAIQFTVRLEAGEELNTTESLWAEGLIRQTLEYIDAEQPQEGVQEVVRLAQALARCTSRPRFCRFIQTSRKPPYQRLKFEQDKIERLEAERMAVIEGQREAEMLGKQVPLSGSIPMEKKPEKTEN